MKGQYMLLMCIIFLFALITLKFGISTVANEQSLRGIYTKRVNNVLMDGIEKTFFVSAYNKSYIEYNFENFISYVKNSYSFNLLAVETNIPTVSANENTTFNVTIFNSLGRRIFNVDLNFSYDGSSRFLGEIGDGESVRVNFTFNISSDSTFEINFIYYSPDKSEKTISVPVHVNRSNFVYYVKAVFLNGQTEELYGNFFT